MHKERLLSKQELHTSTRPLRAVRSKASGAEEKALIKELHMDTRHLPAVYLKAKGIQEKASKKEFYISMHQLPAVHLKAKGANFKLVCITFANLRGKHGGH